jgi:hypothetical protein
MKNSVVTLAILATLVANANSMADYAIEKVSQQLVTVLQAKSAREYVKLYPSLDEFHRLMKDNAIQYGPFLKEAQEEFALQYNTKVIPGLKASFENLIREGESRGIVWSEIEFISSEVNKQPESQIGTASFTVVISSKGKVYQIQIDEALLLNGQWKVSRFIKFV